MQGKSKKVSKLIIGGLQVRAAVQLYNSGNYIAAITLAGAAEEVLSKYAVARTERDALLDDKAFVDQIADHYKIGRPSLEKVKATRNRLKNELKHSDRSPTDFMETTIEELEHEAWTFIVGAIRNFEMATGHKPNDRTIMNWWNSHS